MITERLAAGRAAVQDLMESERYGRAGRAGRWALALLVSARLDLAVVRQSTCNYRPGPAALRATIQDGAAGAATRHDAARAPGMPHRAGIVSRGERRATPRRRAEECAVTAASAVPARGGFVSVSAG